MGGLWLSDTRHLDPKVPGGEGGFWLCDTRHLDPKVTGKETQRVEKQENTVYLKTKIGLANTCSLL